MGVRIAELFPVGMSERREIARSFAGGALEAEAPLNTCIEARLLDPFPLRTTLGRLAESLTFQVCPGLEWMVTPLGK